MSKIITRKGVRGVSKTRRWRVTREDSELIPGKVVYFGLRLLRSGSTTGWERMITTDSTLRAAPRSWGIQEEKTKE